MALSIIPSILIKAESGQATITDSVASLGLTGGSATVSNLTDGTYGQHWRITGGSKSAALSGMGDLTAETVTIVFRFRIGSRAGNYTRFMFLGNTSEDGVYIGNAGTSSGNLRAAFLKYGTALSNASPTYTNNSVTTYVMRMTEGAAELSEIWEGTTGRIGTSPDFSNSAGNDSFSSQARNLLQFTASTENLDIFDYALFVGSLTDAECAAIADDPRGQLYSSNATPSFTGPNIGNQTGTVGTSLTSNNIASKFSDTDALTFSAVGSWPPGVTVSSAGVISGTPTAAGTYASLKVRATDTAAQTVDSDTFSFTINSAAHLITAANSQQVNTASSAAVLLAGSGTITLPALKDWGTGNLKANESGVTIIINNASTGALVNLLTGQTANASGVLPALTGLVSGTAYRVTTILADGSEGTWKYTAS